MNAAPHPFSLRQLQYFLHVAESRSFRRAAEACRVSQPALSAQIAALEDGLGVRLFDRDRRRVILTGPGQQLLDRVRHILVNADDLIDAARLCCDPFGGTLRLGVIPTISPYLIPELVPAIKTGHPRLTIHWTEQKTEVLVDRVQNGSIDAAVLALEAPLGDVEKFVIGADPFVLAMPPGHALARSHAPARLRDLEDAPVLLLDEGHCLRDQALSFCARARAHELDFRATSLSTLVQMVAAGTGVTLLPRLAVPVETRRCEIALRPMADPPPRRTIGLVWRRRAALTPALRAVGATFRKAYEAMDLKRSGGPTSESRRSRVRGGRSAAGPAAGQ